MNKPSWLSWINFILLVLILCSIFGVINPKQWIENFQNTSGIEVKTPIQKIEEILTKHDERLKNLENNENKYVLQSDIDNISNNLQSQLDLIASNFNQYYKELNHNISENKKLIQSLKGITNISEQIKYWQKHYNENFCFWDNRINSDLCKELRNRINNLQQKLPY